MIDEKEILQTLTGNGQRIEDYYLVQGSPVPCIFSKSNGLMAVLIEDDLLAEACVKYLVDKGVRVFNSTEEERLHLDLPEISYFDRVEDYLNPAQLSGRAQRYNRTIRRVLQEQWEPIKSGKISHNDENFDLLVAKVQKLVIHHAPIDKFIETLSRAETGSEVSPGDQDHNLKVVEKLLEMIA